MEDIANTPIGLVDVIGISHYPIADMNYQGRCISSKIVQNAHMTYYSMTSRCECD